MTSISIEIACVFVTKIFFIKVLIMASYLYLFGQKIGTKNILYARSSFYSTKKMLTATNHHLDVEKNGLITSPQSFTMC